MIRRWLLGCFALGIALTTGIAPAADSAEPTYTDPQQADDDFLIQGEYSGEAELEGGKAKVGAQVVAQGDGRFLGVMYVGGLPGDGWDGITKFEGQGQRDDQGVQFTHADGSGHVAGNTLVLADGSGLEIGSLQRVERRSPTEGLSPPDGAVVLFNGTTAEAFEGGRMTDDGLLMAGVTSKQRFQDHQLHLEFRTPYMPASAGQKRGNSGCYLQGRYEVQILDSFGLEGEYNECGGIYEIKPPSENLCYPPLAWQTYDIDYTAARYNEQGEKTANARITVRHNGVMIHDNVELPQSTRAAPVKEGPEPGPLYLQDHGNPVRFRNIWVVEK